MSESNQQKKHPLDRAIRLANEPAPLTSDDETLRYYGRALSEDANRIAELAAEIASPLNTKKTHFPNCTGPVPERTRTDPLPPELAAFGCKWPTPCSCDPDGLPKYRPSPTVEQLSSFNEAAYKIKLRVEQSLQETLRRLMELTSAYSIGENAAEYKAATTRFDYERGSKEPAPEVYVPKE